MALVTCADVGVVEGSISLPRYGVWHADLLLSSNDASPFSKGSAVKISIADGALELSGTCRYGANYLESVRVRIVGGAGGLSQDAKPKHYQGVSARDVLSDLLGAAGETLSSTADAGVLATRFDRWTTLKVPTGEGVRLVARAAGEAAWRVLPDGKIWLGAESWPAFSTEMEWSLEDQQPQDRMILLAVDAPLLVPGVSFDDFGKVSYVEHLIGEAQVRTRAWLE